jgi:hypothetical protein
VLAIKNKDGFGIVDRRIGIGSVKAAASSQLVCLHDKTSRL